MRMMVRIKMKNNNMMTERTGSVNLSPHDEWD